MYEGTKHAAKNILVYYIQMMLKILEKTPGLLFTIVLLAFVIGTMVDSVLDAKNANEAVTTDVKK